MHGSPFSRTAAPQASLRSVPRITEDWNPDISRLRATSHTARGTSVCGRSCRLPVDMRSSPLRTHTQTAAGVPSPSAQTVTTAAQCQCTGGAAKAHHRTGPLPFEGERPEKGTHGRVPTTRGSSTPSARITLRQHDCCFSAPPLPHPPPGRREQDRSTSYSGATGLQPCPGSH
ncbi:hypothetical protein OH76DRAFT_1031440 [Lentinus brumalis]|uniref:Uncharacterized protein n=1 Tax=Lentinus brumalis TaxID=2498619 RepID=A0A371CXD8_9APHY|nr:hypothetical protein OH76DRAFT_1031440 [Polyporus brumalis]